MDKVIYDVRVYANDVVDRLIALKDMNRDKLSRSEIETLNDAANLIYHNIKEIVRE
jgi:GMP synthase PP-ATPase subunit